MAFKRKWLRMLSGLVLTMSLSGCSWGTALTGAAPETPRLPQTTQELVASQPGALAGTHFYRADYPYRQEIANILNRLPPLPDGFDSSLTEVYWAELLGLFAEDYLSPQMVVDRWRMASFGDPDVGDSRLLFRENFNVQIILDASGSMREKIGETTKMELAKEAIKEFAQALPPEARISLRIYGHKGTGSEADKQLSCSSSDLVYQLQAYDEARLDMALKQFAPSGWTGIAHSLRLAEQDLSHFPADKNTNIIYLVSDGIETCGGDPVQVARELSESTVMPLLNVIGFDVNAEGQKQLKEIAQASEGLYANVTNQEQFRQELERAREIAEKWEQWKRDALSEVDAVLIDRKKWVDAYDRDWYDKNWRESLNIEAAVNYLAQTGRIGSQAQAYLTQKRQEREAFIARSKDELIDYLVNLTTETYSEMRLEIEQKYSGG